MAGDTWAELGKRAVPIEVVFVLRPLSRVDRKTRVCIRLIFGVARSLDFAALCMG